MSFKPAKSRSLVLKKGKVNDKFRFSILARKIPCLGKSFNSSLKDSSYVQSTCQELGSWLRADVKFGLPGKIKAWIYQHGILPSILWSLLVYEVLMSTLEVLERKVSSY